jgi:hypothetical protein
MTFSTEGFGQLLPARRMRLRTALPTAQRIPALQTKEVIRELM